MKEIVLSLSNEFRRILTPIGDFDEGSKVSSAFSDLLNNSRIYEENSYRNVMGTEEERAKAAILACASELLHLRQVLLLRDAGEDLRREWEMQIEFIELLQRYAESILKISTN